MCLPILGNFYKWYFHKWSRWTVYATNRDGGIYQRRECERCGKIQTRIA